MENENKNRISGVETPIGYMAKKSNSSLSLSASIRNAPGLMEEVQLAIDAHTRDEEVANNVVENKIKTPIDLVGDIERAKARDMEAKYQEARNER